MNKDLSVDGNEYISASRASEKLGYAQDHIGALIRRGKVRGKMIGRDWYVDFNSLVDHKNNRKGKKSKVELDNPKKIDWVEKRNEVSKSKIPLTYEKEFAPILPNLSRMATIPTYVASIPVSEVIENSPKFVLKPSKKKVSSHSNILVIVTCLFVIASTIGVASKNISLISSATKNLVANVLGSNTTQVTNIPTASANATNTNGIVVVADKNDHAEAVAKAKNAFSDEVNVSVDQDGNAGVVTPVFHPGDDTEHYTFVLVPVKPKK